MAKQSVQTGIQPVQKVDERLPHWQPESIDENLSKNIKAYLSSDAIQKITASDHLEVKNKDGFINFTNCLIGGLRYTSFCTCGLTFNAILLTMHLSYDLYRYFVSAY